jgi:hypothetical protein
MIQPVVGTPADDVDDAALVQRINAGSREALELLITKHQRVDLQHRAADALPRPRRRRRDTRRS